MRTSTKPRAGYSLVEVMVALTLSTFILASSYATIISLAKGSKVMTNYTEMNTQTRAALEIFGRDARMASDVRDFTSTKFSLFREVWNPANNRYVERFIVYEYRPTAQTFTKTTYAVSTGGGGASYTLVGSETLLFMVEDFDFLYYRLVDSDNPNSPPYARTVPEVKHVEIKAKLRRPPALTVSNTHDIISARFMMRNKDVSE